MYLRKHVVRQHAARTGGKRVVLLVDRQSPRAFDLFLRIPSAAAAAAHISPTPPSPTPTSRPQRQSESSRNRLSLTNSSERSIFDFGRCLRWVGAPTHNLLLFRARRRLPFDISNDREGTRERGTEEAHKYSTFARLCARENFRDPERERSLPPSPTESLFYSLLLTKSNQECVGFPLSPPKKPLPFLSSGNRNEERDRRKNPLEISLDGHTIPREGEESGQKREIFRKWRWKFDANEYPRPGWMVDRSCPRVDNKRSTGKSEEVTNSLCILAMLAENIPAGLQFLTDYKAIARKNAIIVRINSLRWG